MKVYLRGKKKLKHLTYPQPDVKASNYEDWMSEDSIVMGWLWNLTLLLVMSNRGKIVISCTLYINNILCVRVDLSNAKTLSQLTIWYQSHQPAVVINPPITTHRYCCRRQP